MDEQALAQKLQKTELAVQALKREAAECLDKSAGGGSGTQPEVARRSDGVQLLLAGALENGITAFLNSLVGRSLFQSDLKNTVRLQRASNRNYSYVRRAHPNVQVKADDELPGRCVDLDDQLVRKEALCAAMRQSLMAAQAKRDQLVTELASTQAELATFTAQEMQLQASWEQNTQTLVTAQQRLSDHEQIVRFWQRLFPKPALSGSLMLRPLERRALRRRRSLFSPQLVALTFGSRLLWPLIMLLLPLWALLWQGVWPRLRLGFLRQQRTLRSVQKIASTGHALKNCQKEKAAELDRCRDNLRRLEPEVCAANITLSEQEAALKAQADLLKSLYEEAQQFDTRVSQLLADQSTEISELRLQLPWPDCEGLHDPPPAPVLLVTSSLEDAEEHVFASYLPLLREADAFLIFTTEQTVMKESTRRLLEILRRQIPTPLLAIRKYQRGPFDRVPRTPPWANAEQKFADCLDIQVANVRSIVFDPSPGLSPRSPEACGSQLLRVMSHLHSVLGLLRLSDRFAAASASLLELEQALGNRREELRRNIAALANYPVLAGFKKELLKCTSAAIRNALSKLFGSHRINDAIEAYRVDFANQVAAGKTMDQLTMLVGAIGKDHCQTILQETCAALYAQAVPQISMEISLARHNLSQTYGLDGLLDDSQAAFETSLDPSSSTVLVKISDQETPRGLEKLPALIQNYQLEAGLLKAGRLLAALGVGLGAAALAAAAGVGVILALVGGRVARSIADWLTGKLQQLRMEHKAAQLAKELRQILDEYCADCIKRYPKFIVASRRRLQASALVHLRKSLRDHIARSRRRIEEVCQTAAREREALTAQAERLRKVTRKVSDCKRLLENLESERQALLADRTAASWPPKNQTRPGGQPTPTQSLPRDDYLFTATFRSSDPPKTSVGTV